jgi:glycosyltransferase involved in cell wall biosynthesis
VLWVGRFDPEKQPLLAIDVAGRCPSIAFDVVGDGEDAAFRAQVRQRAAAVPNILLHGYVPRVAMAALYRNADLLLCTSEQEGFPNVFLEAFSCGVPVISTVDPDHVIVSHAIGRVASTPEELAEAVRSLAQEPAAWRDCSRRARAYFLRDHDPSVVLPVYERHVTALLGDHTLPSI